jgi:hypothetical protein
MAVGLGSPVAIRVSANPDGRVAADVEVLRQVATSRKNAVGHRAESGGR